MSEQASHDQDTVEARRGFLRTVLATGSGAAVLGVASSASATVAGEPAGGEPGVTDSGYRESQHIRDYYKSTAL